MKALLVLVVVCAAIFFVGRTIAPQTIGEQARRVFEKQLREHYVDWDVSIRRGIYRPGIGLQFEGIAFSPKSSGSGVLPLAASVSKWISRAPVEIASITVFADVHPEKFFGDGNPLTTRRVVLDGVHAALNLGADGAVSLAGLWPPPQLGPVCPQIELRSTAIDLTVADQTERPLQIRCNDMVVLSSCDSGGGTQLGAKTPSVPSDKRITIRGESDLCGGFEMKLRSHDDGQQRRLTQMQMSVTNWKIDQSVLSRLQPWLGDSKIITPELKFEMLGDLQVQFQHLVRPNQPTTLDYTADLAVHRAMWLDKRIGDDIRDLKGAIHCTPQRIELLPSSVRLGDALCQATASADLNLQMLPSEFVVTTPQDSPVLRIPMGPSTLVVSVANADLVLSAEDLQIDRRYESILPSRSMVLFDRFEPNGQIDVNARLRSAFPLALGSLAGSWLSQWQINAEVYCDQVDVNYEKFPYPIEQLTGWIHIADGQVNAERLTGLAGGRRMHCQFEVPLKLTPEQVVTPKKKILIQSEGAIPIDHALIASLTPRDGEFARVRMPHPLPGATIQSDSRSVSKLESFVRSLHPRGAVELASALFQTDEQGTTTRQVDLRVTGGTLRYDHFAYPLYNVDGRIQVRDDLVRIIGFTANNAGAAKIACDGLYEMPLAEDRTDGLSRPSELNLRFRVADLAMDQALRVSLPESSRPIWDALTPAGTLDQVDVQIHQRGSQPIDLSLTAAQRSGESVQPNALSIRPKAIPYRIDIVGGKVTYQNQRVVIENLRGRHDASRLIADGVCEPDTGGQWWLSMDLHTGCRLIPDEELIAALPEQMAWAMRGLDLRGPLGIRGTTHIRLPDETHPDPALDWDVTVQLEGNRISDVGPVHSLRGEIDVRGIKEGEIIRAGGRVAIDSLHAFGLQATGIRGPFSIAGDLLRLGTLSSADDPITGQPLRSTNPLNERPVTGQAPVVGNLFGGLIDISGTVALSSGDFDVGVSLSDAKIATILAEMGQTRSGIKGRFDMNSRIEGRLNDTDLLKGSGTGRLSGANLYELPLIVQTLNLLRITPTEAVAFTDGETQFSLFGEDVHFNRLTLWGDLVALDGGGTLSRQEHLDLTFNTRVSPQNLFSKVISPLRDTSYTFWTIEVDGPLASPTIQRRALSGVSQTLEDWFPGMVRSTTADTSAVSR
ncbi:hypothetical protein [Neorhodopirellula pilleata]|uniref:hypothetical protein n=1 Tax=Neorhodopirellula pilleata TaxID=2714738 RepID=UPI001E6076E3|nr:hypothetical protein [Neorhodopirellula pilleata]